MNRIYLIGYMGSGKSTIGRLLANALNWEFCDLDDLIEARSGRNIVDLFEYYGEEEFRNIEASAVHQTTLLDGQVIATGGGAPCHFNNIEVMKNEGLVIYLKGNIDLLIQRIKVDVSNIRPLLLSKTPEELTAFIGTHLEVRRAYYEQAHHIVNIDNTKEKVLGVILDVVKQS